MRADAMGAGSELAGSPAARPWPAAAGPRHSCLLAGASGGASARPWAPLWERLSAWPCPRRAPLAGELAAYWQFNDEAQGNQLQQAATKAPPKPRPWPVHHSAECHCAGRRRLSTKIVATYANSGRAATSQKHARIKATHQRHKSHRALPCWHLYPQA